MFHDPQIKRLFLIAITCFSLISSQVASLQTCVPPPAGLMSWWPGDGNANDVVGANHGTLQNGVTFSPGMVAQAFSFDGVDDYVQFADIFDGLNGGFTLDAWIRTTSITGNKAIIAKYWTTGGSWVIRTNESDPGKVDFTVCSPSCESLADAVQLISTSNVNDGAWHFVAATFDGTTQLLYVDGELEASAINTNPSWADNHHFCIGSFCDPSGNSFLSFSGLIDEVEIYNRALTVSEINAIYNAGSTGKCKATTVTIDIKPGSFPNSIHLSSNGVVPVAILSSDAFDATTVSPTTITLASAAVRLKGNGTPIASFQDVNNDGRLDLVVQVNTEALQLSDGDTQATLMGQTFDGNSITGTDSVSIVP
jgi:hypothetical protein